MTLGTGKRSYSACLRCRQRKTKCKIDRTGETKKPLCVSCRNSGAECVFVKSRRGGNFHSKHRPSKKVQSTECDLPQTTSDNDSVSEPVDGDVFTMELRNPSDALRILALSGKERALNQGLCQAAGTKPNGQKKASIHTRRAAPSSTLAAFSPDEYELVRRGLLSSELVLELLQRYLHHYHPYCPFVPSYFLTPPAGGRFPKSANFLLTAILTVASRDDPAITHIHRHCWEYTQKLLVDVLLAAPWTLTPRTVEGLLLLAEWLPHLHIHHTTPETQRSLCDEDRTAWSLIGLAVRLGYLQRLDQAAFPGTVATETKEEAEQNRLVWTSIYIADRQISVRLGQSFWSRGPSLATRLTAGDFPSLRPGLDGNEEDFASAMQATMELIQILHNTHAILYSSKDRTLSMMNQGHYARYLDDYRQSATAWHASWRNIAVSSKIKTTLLIMYEYINIYANAFSFQAVLTRASNSRRASQGSEVFTRISSSPDGRYLLDAISAAINLLTLINSLDPKQTLCYLPSRYHLYGVYAAVLLHKAECVGAFETESQREKVTAVARKYVRHLQEAAPTELHVCHRYSQMLERLWHPRDQHNSNPSDIDAEIAGFDRWNEHSSSAAEGGRMADKPGPDGGLPFTNNPIVNDLDFTIDINDYFLGSFMPGVADQSPMDMSGEWQSDQPLMYDFDG